MKSTFSPRSCSRGRCFPQCFRVPAKEVGPAGVRVNCICPGVIDTDMNASLSFDDVASLSDDIPLMRLGSAEEVAGAAVFLASQAASYITGAVIDINGGWMG